MKVKRWSRPAYTLFAILFIAVLCFTFLPISIPFGGAGVAHATVITTTYSTAGTYYWICPEGLITVQVQVWGAGGAGGTSAGSAYGGGGAGGGAYSITTALSVVPGGNYTVVVGLGGVPQQFFPAGDGGDSYFGNSTTVMAKGGNHGRYHDEAGAGTGGLAASGYGDTKYSGGTGHIWDHTLTTGYGGGSSAGTDANGVDSTNINGATAPTGGGNGGAGGANHTAGNPGVAPGGGGGGAGHNSTNLAGGAGADGKVILTYTCLTVTTLAATSITASSATLNGNVTSLGDFGNVTSYGFVLSTSTQTNPGNVSPTLQTKYLTGNWTWTGVQYAAGTTFNSNGNVTDLSKGTCYYFRAAGYSTYGWVYGDELTFPMLSDAPTGCTVTVYTSFSVSWSWTNGAGYGNSTWRYKTGSYPTSTTDGTSAYLGNLTSAQVTGLVGNTTYYFTGWSLAYCNGATSTSTGNCSFTQTTRVAQIVTLDLQVGASTDDCDVYYDGDEWNIDSLSAVSIPVGFSSTYSTSAMGGGMRFQNVTIPKEAIVTNAYLTLTCYGSTAVGTVNSYITGDKPLNGNSAAFGTLDNYETRRGDVFSGKTNDYRTTAQVAWDSIPAWTANTPHMSTEIKAVIQEIIDGNWTSGNALALFLDDHDYRSTPFVNSYRNFHTYDGNATYAPKLHIEYFMMPTTTVWAQGSTVITGSNMVRACLLNNGSRYLALTHWTEGETAIRIYNADANWVIGDLVSTSDFTCAEAFGGTEYPTLGSPLGAGIILFWGRADYPTPHGFVATYNVGNDTWTHAYQGKCDWLGDCLYRPADGRFYINSSMMCDTCGDYYNKFAYSTVANILTPANWVTVNLPAWGGPALNGTYYEEPKAVIFGNNMYIMQQDDYSYYWRLFKWDFTVEDSPTMGDGHFTLIDSSTDTTLAQPQNLISVLGANDSMVAVALPYASPYPHWVIKYYTEGNTWETVITLGILGKVGEVDWVYCENFSNCFPYGSDKLFIQVVSEGNSLGYTVLVDVNTGLLEMYFPGTLGYPGNSNSYFIVDGSNLVVGEQNWRGDARLTIYAIPDISNTPSSHDFGVVQPSQTYWAKTGLTPPSFPLGDGNCTGNVTNNSSFAIDVLFSMGNLTGGTQWTIGNTSGTNIFRLRVFFAGAGNDTTYSILSSTPTVLISNQAAGNSTYYELVLDTPTNAAFPDGVQKSGNITLTAEAH